MGFPPPPKPLSVDFSSKNHHHQPQSDFAALLPSASAWFRGLILFLSLRFLLFLFPLGAALAFCIISPPITFFESSTETRTNRKRKGKGISAGQGNRCGFGMRDQKSRPGPGVRKGFEGGQMPLYRRLPKLRGIAGGNVQSRLPCLY